ncbi:MAG: hydroxymethylbilane synthase [Zetaproteobacteria bacterium CG06_land_8_20_14_3_00_59_53]|nr:MAG: hydroxymethylbilane synthase [Zetaproteobacteria bacterium CG2_30_59_37]PIO88818.1 MAG: hydroxymethylbilane synthase [Zetaproteobacteria bacterium CG23_combo_of_CG06-09_8_20_14_all_59_86]PIQ64540.1 MAG: hydroxymethylbilane synthase [Zetaproteobacteria bacterium CG11_big_fil_rev_8_21_14_0_20_59_439]PIU70049.1 MAG: hydroxymethylbilane synthase [Zetaproteobacteria bacterium CG06_land_8_20_14_3_00_59_53]PIU98006.1 MAG: hydroxymethylbilane synthase [Zetaproteobacteria bacterium CG03_land_8_2
MHIKIATRRSPLALWQAEHVSAELKRLDPSVTTELVKIVTRGDKILDVPLAQVGGKGLFTKEIDEALLDGRADIAVHSMKDVPTELPAGTGLCAHPLREDPRDAVATITGGALNTLPAGARIGTSSLRRIAQLREAFPTFEFVSIRGNIQTRLSKLGKDVDAVILAAAGVLRMGMADQMHDFISTDLLLPAVAQGTLGIQTRDDDAEVNALVSRMNDEETVIRTRAERAFLARLEGGCQVPIAAFATLNGDTLNLRGLVGEVDGSRILRSEISGHKNQAEALGIKLADEVLDAGGREILARLYAAEANKH